VHHLQIYYTIFGSKTLEYVFVLTASSQLFENTISTINLFNNAKYGIQSS